MSNISNAFRRLVIDTIPEDKRALSNEVRIHVQAYEARGGIIHRIPMGVSGVENKDWGHTLGYVDKRKRGAAASAIANRKHG